MTVTFLMHGVLIQLAGSAQLSIENPNITNVQTALDLLAKDLPALATELQRTACAIGDELVGRDAPVLDGVELALIPPVSGG